MSLLNENSRIKQYTLLKTFKGDKVKDGCVNTGEIQCVWTLFKTFKGGKLREAVNTWGDHTSY